MNNYNQLDVNHTAGEGASQVMRQAAVVGVELFKTLIRLIKELISLAVGR